MPFVQTLEEKRLKIYGILLLRRDNGSCYFCHRMFLSHRISAAMVVNRETIEIQTEGLLKVFPYDCDSRIRLSLGET